MNTLNILYCSTFRSHRAHRELVRLASTKDIYITALPWVDTANGVFKGHFPVDAVISHLDPSLMPRFTQGIETLPHVTLHAESQVHLAMPGVVSDHVSAGRMVAEHFLAFGFRNFATFVDKQQYDTFDQRVKGFSQVVSEAGCALPTVVAMQSDRPSDEKTLDDFGKALSSMPLPLAIMAANDRVAVKVMEACRLCDLSIPSQIAICGFDNDPLTCDVAPVPLSSVDTDPESQMREAFRILMTMFKGMPPPCEALVIPPKGVVVRRSSGLFAHANPAVARAVACIDQHLTDRALDIPFIVARTGVCRTNLFKEFKEAISMTPLQYITQHRVAMAERLLRESRLQINEVRPKCGFASDYQMYQAFNRIHGKSPKAVRNMHLAH